MKKKVLISAVMCALLAVSLIGCGNAGSNSTTVSTQPTTTTTKASTGKKAAMVTDLGGINDQSFNQSAYKGLQDAQTDFGISVSYIESKVAADYIPNMEKLIDDGNDIIFGIGFALGDDLATVAGNHPGQQFAIIDYGYDTPIPNVTTINFASNESSYLVGYIAGKMTAVNKVGFVGGVQGAVIDTFQYGYMAGVKKANPACDIEIQYADSFADSAKGKAIAQQMITDGCDIIFHASGGTGIGVIEACKEGGIKAIGVDQDQNYLAPDTVITSAMKMVGQATYDLSKEVNDGTYAGGGQNLNYNLANKGVGIAPNSKVPQNILDDVATLTQQIIDGTITVPYDEASYNAQQ